MNQLLLAALAVLLIVALAIVALAVWVTWWVIRLMITPNQEQIAALKRDH